MASAEVNPSHFSSTLTTHPHLSNPLPKRSRLSLRRTTQFLHKPCYKEDDNYDGPHKKPNQQEPTDADGKKIEPTDANIEMIDLTQDENTSPNCNSSSVEVKTETAEADEEEEEEVKVWTLGLPNCGNTCYVNSILQVLRYTPDFMNSLHSLLLAWHQLAKVSTGDEETKEMIFFKYMHSLFSAMKRKEALMRVNIDKDYCAFLLKPVKLVISSLREVSTLFEEGEQHDAHELLITTISAFNTARQSLKNRIPTSEKYEEESSSAQETDSKSSSLSPEGNESKKQTMGAKRRKISTKHISFDESLIQSLNLGFEGRIRHVVQCLECEKRIEREESFANLEVNIPELEPDEDSVDLSDCLSQTTILSGENKFFCADCLHYNEARMNSEVISLPPILLLHFSWLRRTQEISNVEKTSIKVIIPRSLQTSENSEVFCCTPDETYKLFAVVLHIGRSTEGGHYVSFVKDAYQNIVIEDCERKTLKPKFRSSHFTTEIEECCTTEEIANFKTIDTTTKWLLFDDNVVSPVCIEEDSESFPYFNYLSITASPCMIFYHKT